MIEVTAIPTTAPALPTKENISTQIEPEAASEPEAAPALSAPPEAATGQVVATQV